MRAQPGRQYTKEFKEAIINGMMPPNNESIKSLSEETEVTETTLYKWMWAFRANGNATPGDGQGSDKWNSEDPSQIVPKLADQSICIASGSTFYRVLRMESMQNHRGRSKRPVRRLPESILKFWRSEKKFMKRPASKAR